MASRLSLVSVATVLVASVARAHPGHGGAATYSLVHGLLDHGALVALVTLVAVLGAGAAVRRASRAR